MIDEALESPTITAQDSAWLENLMREGKAGTRGIGRGGGEYTRLRSDDLKQTCAIFHRCTHAWILSFLLEAGIVVREGARIPTSDLWLLYRMDGTTKGRKHWTLAGRNVFRAACVRGGLEVEWGDDGSSFYANLKVPDA